MSDAPILIVDEHDNPIGSATKEEAWQQGLIHRAVRFSIYNSKGQLLVQKRSPNKKIFPNCWDNSAAGHVDAGETYEQAAVRELQEEIGITLPEAHLEFVGSYYVDAKDDWRILRRFTRYYTLTLDDPVPELKLAKDEITEIQWMDISDVVALVKNEPQHVSDGLEQIVTRYLAPNR